MGVKKQETTKILVDTTGRVYSNGHESYWFGAVNVQLSIMANLCPRHRPQSSIRLRAPSVVLVCVSFDSHFVFKKQKRKNALRS